MTNLALVNLDDLKVILAESEIKNEVWDAQRAAEFLKISRPTLVKFSQSGQIPAVKIGSEWKFSSIALFEFVAKKGVGV